MTYVIICVADEFPFELFADIWSECHSFTNFLLHYTGMALLYIADLLMSSELGADKNTVGIKWQTFFSWSKLLCGVNKEIWILYVLIFDMCFK